MDFATLIWWVLAIGGVGATIVIAISVAMVVANRKPDE